MLSNMSIKNGFHASASFLTSITLPVSSLRAPPARRDGLPFSAFALGGEGIAGTSVKAKLDGERFVRGSC
jgi:hypothetical protein